MKQTRLTVTGLLDNFCYKQIRKSKVLGKSRQVQIKPEKSWGLGCQHDAKPAASYKQDHHHIYWSIRLWAFKHLHWRNFLSVFLCGTWTHPDCQQGRCQWCQLLHMTHCRGRGASASVEGSWSVTNVPGPQVSFLCSVLATFHPVCGYVARCNWFKIILAKRLEAFFSISSSRRTGTLRGDHLILV